MYNSKYVILGIIIFAVVFTAPFWVGGFAEYKAPKLVLPVNEKDCVEPVEFMRAEHMQLLNTWRDEALRNENRVYVSSTGKKWEISLQNTCMKCHNNKVDFCDKCHISNSVYPYCWTCHIVPTADSNVKPAVNSDVKPAVNSDVTPAVNSDVAPAVNSDVKPAVNSDVAPVVNSDVAPVVNSDVAPVVNSNVAPKGDSNE